MSFNFSKSRFVSACTFCNKYAWLDKYKPEEKTPVGEFTKSLFDNGHKVGALAKEYFGADVDVTVCKKNGSLDLAAMIENTKKHIAQGTGVIAEASFSFGGFFCSVDILSNNGDGTYNLYEVKSSKLNTKRNKKLGGVKEKYIIDASYQKYVLGKCGVRVNRVFVVLLSEDYVRMGALDLSQYFVECDVTSLAESRQAMIADKLSELGTVLADGSEPVSVFSKKCSDCDYWNYCSRNVCAPSAFDLYGLNFNKKCELYNGGVSFFDVPKHIPDLKGPVLRQIEYYNRPCDAYIDKAAVKKFLDELSYPVYSLDFETYQAVVPEHDGMKNSEQVPFQYSLHIIDSPGSDMGDVRENHFLDLSGADTRRPIAESLVKNIPYGACVVAYHESTERNIIKGLASLCPDLADHLLSFTYKDPLTVFESGSYYVSAMGKSFSIKSVAPALYPNDRDMDYHNLEGDVRNGVQAMNVYFSASKLSCEEREKVERDLLKYCALDTLSVVKILKKFYEVTL